MTQTSDRGDFQSAFEAGQATQIVTADIEGVQHILVPPGCTLQSMERLMDAPIRIKAHPSFNDVAGFAEYVKEFAEEGSRVFVDDAQYRFTTVFDCHAKDQPAWGDHSASITMGLAPEWKRFREFDSKAMSPKVFAEFLEDNVAYVDTARSGMSGADVLTMAQTFKVDIKGELDVEESLSQGLRKLVIKDDSTLRGKNVQGKELSFPEKLHFNLRIFKNHSAYPIEVFLRTRTTKEQVVFLIKIPDPEGLLEEAFDRVIEDVCNATGLPTLKGSFEGPSHKK
ncbi:MAG: DUF2303 family protein [Gammaproteobacteria bacterium]|nr:DUF2303 family protein [Gammaproteobacteria bacterium]